MTVQKPHLNGTIKAAGIMYIEDNHVLLLKRPDGSWAFPGGKIEDGETPLQAACRESAEEVGFKPDYDLCWQIDFFNNGKVHFTTFCAMVGFEVILNTDEHSEYQWCAFGDLPDVMHPNARATIEKYTRSHLGVGLDSARTKDFNGWIEIKRNPISKVGVFPYAGRNISAECDPDATYMVLRPEEELANPRTIESFKLIPWIDEHVMLGPPESGMLAPEMKGIEGVIGEDVFFESPYLYANIKVFSDNLAELTTAGKRELSAGYRCKYKKSSGNWNGQPYDYVQTDIRGNHLALVQEGRMGPDVAVLDHLTITFDAKDIIMADPEMKKQMDELCKTVGDAIKAMDSKLDALDKKVTDAVEEKEDPAIAADKKAKDEAEEAKKDEEKKAEDKKAMDTSIKSALDAALAPLAAQIGGFIKAQSAMDESNRKAVLVKQLTDFGVGVDSMDTLSAADLSVKAVEKLGLRCEKGQEQTALDGYFHNRTPADEEVGFALDQNSGTGSGKAVDEFFTKAA